MAATKCTSENLYQSEFMTAEEIAMYLNISRSAAYKLIDDRKVRALRIGKLVRVRRTDLEVYISRQTSGRSQV